MRKLILGALSAVLVVGCAGGQSATSGLATPEPVATTTVEPVGGPVTPAPSGTPFPVAVVTPEPTPVEQPGTGQYKLGETVTLTQEEEPWADITISKVSQHKSYGSGYSVSKPKKGKIYIQAWVSYKALADNVDYNPYDWQVFVGDTAVDDTAFVFDGPDPELHSGTLPKGRKAEGWVVYEVPLKGRVVISYGGGTVYNEAPVFEVTIRAS